MALTISSFGYVEDQVKSGVYNIHDNLMCKAQKKQLDILDKGLFVIIDTVHHKINE